MKNIFITSKGKHQFTMMAKLNVRNIFLSTCAFGKSLLLFYFISILSQTVANDMTKYFFHSQLSIRIQFHLLAGIKNYSFRPQHVFDKTTPFSLTSTAKSAPLFYVDVLA